MRMALLTAALVSVAAAPAAQAQTVFFGGGPGTVVESRSIPVDVTGSVTVDWTGDPAGGCAAAGLCDVTGSASFALPDKMELFWVRSKTAAGRQTIQAFLSGGTDGATSTTQVDREAADGSNRPCTDVQRTPEGLKTTQGPAGITLGAGAFLLSRCSAPVSADVASLIPTRSLPLELLRKGSAAVSLRGGGRFNVGPFQGLVRSSVALFLGRPKIQSLRDTTRLPPGVRRSPVRTVSSEWSIASVSGEVRTNFLGVGERLLCAPLDACNSSGAVTLSPQASSGEFVVVAAAAGRPSWASLRAAIGIGSARPPARVSYVFAGGGWERGTGTAAAEVRRDDGSVCRDQAPSTLGGLYAEGSRTVLRAHLLAPPGPATRCAGPNLADESGVQPVASGSIPLKTFGGRTATFVLNRGSSLRDDAWTGRSAGSVTVTLRRERVRRSTSFQVTGW